MKSIRWISAGAVVGGLLLLSGCVAVPGSYGYDTGYYSQPAYVGGYYGEPAPVVVAPSVYLQGGTHYDRGYYNRGYDDRRPGYARPRYDGPRPGAGPRPGDGGRPVAGPGPRPGPQNGAGRPQISSQERNVRNGFTPGGAQKE